MARTKQTGRRTAREIPPPLPCLSNYAEEDWFEEDSEKKAYSERLSRMHIISPRYVGDGAIPEDKYLEFWRYYPRFVAAAFASVVVDDKIGEDGQGTFHLCVLFMGRTFNFLLERIAEAWGLRNAGTIFCGGSNPHSEWNEFEKMDAARALRLDPASSGKYHVSKMTTTHRLLLYVISRILMPRKSNYGSATEEDLLLLWAMINEKQINWPYLMAHNLVKYSDGKVNSALGLPHLWGKVFPLIPLDVSQEEFVASKPEFAITSKNINQIWLIRMGLKRMFLRGTFVLEQMCARVDEGFAKIADRIDSIDISLISQADEMWMLRDRFLELVGEVPPTTEPTAEAPTETAPTAEVPSTNPPGVDEVTRTDDPAAEDGTEVAPVVADQGEGVQAAMETTEVVQEQSVESPAHD
ncbi:hypothetical protein PIB30_053358 [Stylosanthes scabra]|uniref:Aminotransferase-like plant mobile domain-containing protein n=1 Tax=Stylosanthes scabra TaxID=79078 RepID=A0ABU6YKW7_9FABA|nr:hypothetical protein [Stylosanthes scabra]